MLLNFTVYLKTVDGLGKKFIINEYWILIPATMLIQYLVLKRYFHKHPSEKAKLKQKLLVFAKMMHYKAWRKHLQTLKCYKLANEDYLGLLELHGGEIFLDEEYFPDCLVEGSGLRYLEDPGMADFLLKEFWSKLGKVFPNVLYITEEAFCLMFRKYPFRLVTLGTAMLSYGPYKYVGITFDFVSLLQKTITITLLGTSFTAGAIGIAAANLIFQRIAVASLLSGILTGYVIDWNITFPPSLTSPAPLAILDSSNKLLGTTKNDEPVVVIVNSRRVERKNMAQCLIARNDDSACDSELISKIPKMEPTNLKYKQVVGLEDVIGVRSIKSENYADYFDQEIPIKPRIVGKLNSNYFAEKAKKLKKVTKLVNFREKFADDKIIPETDSWDVTENIIKKYNEDPSELWD